MADLQEALDGARAELAIKKREDKDSRTREAQLGTQICTVSFPAALTDPRAPRLSLLEVVEGWERGKGEKEMDADAYLIC